MNICLIILGCVVLLWLSLVYSTFYWPPCILALKYFAGALIAVAILNFVSFVVGALIIGGDAASNPSIDGRYYVSEHGRRTEVSHSVYKYSLFHAHSVWLTHPLGLFGFYILYCENKKRKEKPTLNVCPEPGDEGSVPPGGSQTRGR
jgi:hypothetical protein